MIAAAILTTTTLNLEQLLAGHTTAMTNPYLHPMGEVRFYFTNTLDHEGETTDVLPK